MTELHETNQLEGAVATALQVRRENNTNSSELLSERPTVRRFDKGLGVGAGKHNSHGPPSSRTPPSVRDLVLNFQPTAESSAYANPSQSRVLRKESASENKEGKLPLVWHSNDGSYVTAKDKVMMAEKSRRYKQVLNSLDQADQNNMRRRSSSSYLLAREHGLLYENEAGSPYDDATEGESLSDKRGGINRQPGSQDGSSLDHYPATEIGINNNRNPLDCCAEILEKAEKYHSQNAGGASPIVPPTDSRLTKEAKGQNQFELKGRHDNGSPLNSLQTNNYIKKNSEPDNIRQGGVSLAYSVRVGQSQIRHEQTKPARATIQHSSPDDSRGNNLVEMDWAAGTFTSTISLDGFGLDEDTPVRGRTKSAGSSSLTDMGGVVKSVKSSRLQSFAFSFGTPTSSRSASRRSSITSTTSESVQDLLLNEDDSSLDLSLSLDCRHSTRVTNEQIKSLMERARAKPQLGSSTQSNFSSPLTISSGRDTPEPDPDGSNSDEDEGIMVNEEPGGQLSQAGVAVRGGEEVGLLRRERRKGVATLPPSTGDSSGAESSGSSGSGRARGERTSRSDPLQDRKRSAEADPGIRDGNLFVSLNPGTPTGELKNADSQSSLTSDVGVGESSQQEETYLEAYAAVTGEAGWVAEETDPGGAKPKTQKYKTWPNGEQSHQGHLIKECSIKAQTSSSVPQLMAAKMVAGQLNPPQCPDSPKRVHFHHPADRGASPDPHRPWRKPPSTPDIVESPPTPSLLELGHVNTIMEEEEEDLNLLSPSRLGASGSHSLRRYPPPVSPRGGKMASANSTPDLGPDKEQGEETIFRTNSFESSTSRPSKGLENAKLSMDKECRYHVVQCLQDTEMEYVGALEILEKDYMEPLRRPENNHLYDQALYNTIFYRIPEILAFHQSFLRQLKACVKSYRVEERIGEILVNSFSKRSLIELYTSYKCNYTNALEAIDDKSVRESFAKYLDRCSRKHTRRLKIADIIIQPVQRIPRYKLIVDDLLKFTPYDHPDRKNLLRAQSEMETLAKHIDRAESAEQEQQKLRELSALIEGDINLESPNRRFIKQYPILELKMGSGSLSKKERCVFLFNDLLLCTSVKRKSVHRERKISTTVLLPVEANRYKPLWKSHLDDLDLNNVGDLNQYGRPEHDMDILSQISNLSQSLSCSHQELDESVRNLLEFAHRKLVEKNTYEPMAAKKIELTVVTGDGMCENYQVVFNTPTDKKNFENDLNSAKKKLAHAKDSFPPEFLHPLPVMKTRSGMQFSCACPVLVNGSETDREVWVCNSDGYIGQVSLLSVSPLDPVVKESLDVCYARILCISAIPGTQKINHYSSTCTSPTTGDLPLLCASDSSTSDDSDDEDSQVASSSLHIDSSDSEAEDCRPGHRSTKSLQSDGSSEMNAFTDTIWLGGENGYIYIYQRSRGSSSRPKCGKKLHLSAPVLSLQYYENKVFVSLANGNIVIYSRKPGCFWEHDKAQELPLGSSTAPITHMTSVAGKIWCSTHSSIIVLNPESLQTEHVIEVRLKESDPSIQSMVGSGQGVWVSLAQHGSAFVKLYHATNYHHLTDVDLTPDVHKMLAGSDNIIRQHKQACLRVTAMLACKDLLWVGTSAGVILTLPLPKITSSMQVLHSELVPVGSSQGHTGHVRFLASVNLPGPRHLEQPGGSKRKGSLLPPKNGSLDSVYLRRASAHPAMMETMMVISGGDGCEDFMLTVSSETTGKEDSTNHLLFWCV